MDNAETDAASLRGSGSAVDPVGIPAATDIWFIFSAGKVLVKEAAQLPPVIRWPDIAGLRGYLEHVADVGSYAGNRCFSAELSATAPVDLPGELINPRDLLVLTDEDLFRVCGCGLQLLHWEKTNVFCGRCGARTRGHEQERARICPQCGLTVYPRISPAVIVAVVRDGKILLARNRNFRRGFHSVLAGFVEPGETFEDCVRREIREEVGISVGNIRYFGSQPWPFPDSLMVGFTADYEHGELAVDGREIVQADWYAPDRLPAIPPPGSISRKLIDCFVRGELNRN